MESCTTGPKYCQKCGNEIEFGAIICEECTEVLPEKKSLFPQLFSKRPNTYRFIGVLFILISYIYGLSNPNNLFFNLLSTAHYIFYYPTFFLSLLLFTFGLFLVYANIDNELRGLIQICCGVLVLTLMLFMSIPYFQYFYYYFFFIIPIDLSIICGALTMKYGSVYSYLGFFSTIYLVSELNFWIIALNSILPLG
jgi:hypothetical protein